MDLDHFLQAQTGTFPTALDELRHGRKVSHWMWFIFPQLAALGRSATAKRFGLPDLAAARAYLDHPVLSARLAQAVKAVLTHPERKVAEIMGEVDAMKLRSSATLFICAAQSEAEAEPFRKLLDTFFGGIACPLTLAELERQGVA